MMITVSVLAILVFMLASLFAIVMFQFMRKAKRKKKERAAENSSVETEREDQIVTENTQSYMKDKIENPLENKKIEAPLETVLEKKNESTEVLDNAAEDSKESLKKTVDFKPQRAVDEVKDEVKPGKPVRLRSGNVSALAGDNVLATKLDLARAYLDIGSIPDAKKLLRNVLEKGDDAQRVTAQKLLEKFEIKI